MSTNDISAAATTANELSEMKTPKEHWLKGSLGKFHPEAFHTYLYDLNKHLGPIFKITLLKKPIVVLSDTAVIQQMLKSRPNRFRRVSQMETVFKEMGVHGVFSAEGEEWERHRRLMNPAFRPSQVKRFYPKLKKITNNLIDTVKRENEVLNFQALMQRYTVDMTASLSFGFDINTLITPNSELQNNLSAIFPMISSRVKAPIPYWRFIKLKKDREFDQAITAVKSQINEFIESARTNLQSKEEADNILEAMLLARDERGNVFTDAELFGNVMTLLLAGEDTTANTLAWTIHYLADSPELQNEIHKEIIDHYPTSGELTWDDLDNFPLTFGAAQEAIRMKPVAPFLYLEGLEDEELCGYRIPKGTMIIALLSGKSFDNEVFKQPEQFNPKRWLDITPETVRKYANELMPFGAGPRLCPGRQLSFVEMKLGLIELLRNFKFERSIDHGPTQERFLFTVVPDNLMVKAQRWVEPN